MSIEDQLRDALRPLTAEEPPPDLLDRALSKLPRERSSGSPPFFLAGIAAAGFVVVVIGALVLSSSGFSRDPLGGGASALASAQEPSPDGSEPGATESSPSPGTTEAGAIESSPSPATTEPGATESSPSPATTEPGATESSPSPGMTEPGTPTASRTELERSDLFWGPLHTGPGLFHYEFDSLRDMSQQVDLIVLGRITEIRLGPEAIDFDPDEAPAERVMATVTIDEVLKGIPQSRVEGTIQLRLLPAGDDWETIRANVPDHQHLFFLINEAAERERKGTPPEDPEHEQYDYYRPNDQAVLRGIQGAIHLISPWGRGRFPAGLEGEPFDDVVEQVRQVVTEPGWNSRRVSTAP